MSPYTVHKISVGHWPISGKKQLGLASFALYSLYTFKVAGPRTSKMKILFCGLHISNAYMFISRHGLREFQTCLKLSQTPPRSGDKRSINGDIQRVSLDISSILPRRTKSFHVTDPIPPTEQRYAAIEGGNFKHAEDFLRDMRSTYCDIYRVPLDICSIFLRLTASWKSPQLAIKLSYV